MPWRFIYFLISMGCVSSSAMVQAPALGVLEDNQIRVQFPSLNVPTVSVTICSSDNTACETVSNLLLDSGSNGLRIFESAIKSRAIVQSLAKVQNDHGETVLSCTRAGGGESFWGYYALANLQIGKIHGTKIPVQFMGESAAPAPANCLNPVFSAQKFAGMNGILGIGTGLKGFHNVSADAAKENFAMFCSLQGCRPCTSDALTCAKSVGLADMNPIKFLASDNNGWALITPDALAEGSVNATAVLTLGIGTRKNNTPEPGLHVFPIDSDGMTKVQINAKVVPTVFDTGTAFWSLPFGMDIPKFNLNPSLWFYNPTSQIELTAQILDVDLSAIPGGQFSVHVYPLPSEGSNAKITLLPGIASSFLDQGGTIAQEIFLAGYPFFMGRKVYYGLDGAKTPLGSGPFNAFGP